MLVSQTLPPPSPEALAHSERLLSHLRGDVESQGGWIGFARYMDRVLYAPGLGYYSAGAVKLGAAGDFVTAPEISSLFARCLALQCAEILDELDGGDILELGAGTGALAAELIAALDEMGRAPRRYLILEVSADLRLRQRRLLGERAGALAAPVEWLDRLPESPITGVIIANEVADAWPVERFRFGEGGLEDLGVGLENGMPVPVARPAGTRLRERIEAIREANEIVWPAGYTSEVRLDLEPWLTALYDSLDRGAVLFFDYGMPQSDYYRPERAAGTLRCHYRHLAHDDPFVYVGLQDITAWVDFSALAGAAIDAGFAIGGYTTQAQFLIGCDLDGQMIELSSRARATQLELAQQAKRLTLPEEMGERYKALGLTRELERPLRGFTVRDLRVTL
jgi:SAM-dependent MidA family methyltransferase